MPNILRLLDEPAHTLEVVVLKRSGRRVKLRSPLPISPGTPVQLDMEGESLRGEVAVPLTRKVQAGKSPFDCRHSGRNAGALDSSGSVMGSLVALNARLVFYEEHKQAS